MGTKLKDIKLVRNIYKSVKPVSGHAESYLGGWLAHWISLVSLNFQ